MKSTSQVNPYDSVFVNREYTNPFIVDILIVDYSHPNPLGYAMCFTCERHSSLEKIIERLSCAIEGKTEPYRIIRLGQVSSLDFANKTAYLADDTNVYYTCLITAPLQLVHYSIEEAIDLQLKILLLSLRLKRLESNNKVQQPSDGDTLHQQIRNYAIQNSKQLINFSQHIHYDVPEGETPSSLITGCAVYL